MADTLGRLFGNEGRLKILRFLLLNDKKFYTLSELEKRIGLSPREIRKEAIHLRKVGILRGKTAYEAVHSGRKARKVRTLALSANPDFQFCIPLKNLFSTASPLSTEAMVKRLGQTGRVKLVVISGVFLDNPEGRLDLLVVGDRLDRNSVDRAIHSFEKLLGRELRYSTLETSDFAYRLSVYDRLVRDVLDYPHRKILNKIGL